jgi:hypothetical protein
MPKRIVRDATGARSAAEPRNAVLSISGTITQNSTTAVSRSFTLPANSRIVDITFDMTTAFNSATTAVGTVGTAAAGTQYADAVDAKVAGRTRPAFSAAQLAAMANIGNNRTVVATITPTGATSAGAVRVSIQYVPVDA